MRVLVAVDSDPASQTIWRAMQAEWHEDGSFRGRPAFRRGDAACVCIEGPSIFDETLGQELQAWGATTIWVLSKHRAASGQPSLTVHPIGNFRDAQFGGEPATIAPHAARDMGALLRRLHANATELPHSVTYEATHHGPGSPIPILFLELGSDESWYEDAPSGQVIAKSAHEVLDGQGLIDKPILLGVGGGHYVPRCTDMALAGEADFGHLIPNYQLVDAQPLALCFDHDALYMHKKGLKGQQKEIVRNWLENNDLASFP